jgi:hypothetical protein
VSGDLKKIVRGDGIHGNIESVFPVYQQLFQEDGFARPARTDYSGKMLSMRILQALVKQALASVFFSLLPG